MPTVVIALGGNALQEAGCPATAQNQLDAVYKTCAHIAAIVQEGWQVVIAHGNGPQVGRIVLQNEAAHDITPPMPFDVCGAMSQGMIGYHIQQGLQEVLRRQGLPACVATVVTQVVVDENDPGFRAPSKPIGPFYTQEQAAAIAAESGYTFKEDAGRGYRRVVASPAPKEIVEIDAVRALMDKGFIPITVGGGGVPVTRDASGMLNGTAAVIDKDHAAELLAEEVHADVLLILTAVDYVSINYRQPTQRNLDILTPEQAQTYTSEGHFAPGSMRPKVEAAVRFARSGTGRRAIITSLDKAAQALAGGAGTVVMARLA